MNDQTTRPEKVYPTWAMIRTQGRTERARVVRRALRWLSGRER